MKETIPFIKEIVFPKNIATITSISLEHEEKLYSGEINGEFIVTGEYKTHNDTTEKESFKYRLPFSTLIPDNINYDTIVLNIINFTYEQIESDVLRVNIEIIVEGEENKAISVKDIDFESISDTEPSREENLTQDLDDFLNTLDESPVYTIPESEIIAADEIENETSIIENIEARETVEEINNFEKQEIPDIEKTEQTNIVEFNTESNITNITEDIQINNAEKEKTTYSIKESENTKETSTETEIKVEEENTKDEYITYHIHTIKAEDTLELLAKKYNSTVEAIEEINNTKELKPGDKLIIPECQDGE